MLKRANGMCYFIILHNLKVDVNSLPYLISLACVNAFFALVGVGEGGSSLYRLCKGTYRVAGLNIKREKVLSANDEEVASSSKKHTQFKTRVHKPYPISDQNG